MGTHTEGEPYGYGYFHSFTVPGSTGYHRDHGTSNKRWIGDVALSWYSSMELSLAMAQLAFDTAIRHCHPFLPGNDRQLWHSRRTLGMALFDCCMQDRNLVAALPYQSQGLIIQVIRKEAWKQASS